MLPVKEGKKEILSEGERNVDTRVRVVWLFSNQRSRTGKKSKTKGELWHQGIKEGGNINYYLCEGVLLSGLQGRKEGNTL